MYKHNLKLGFTIANISLTIGSLTLIVGHIFDEMSSVLGPFTRPHPAIWRIVFGKLLLKVSRG